MSGVHDYPDPAVRKRRKSEPLYRRIQAHLLDMISSGQLRPGDRLPSEAELSLQFETTRATVVHALQQLVFERVIHRQAGKGSFVAARPIDAAMIAGVRPLEGQLLDSGQTVSFRLIQQRVVEADGKLAADLTILPGSRVFRLERLRIVGGIAMSGEIRHLPYDIGKRINLGWLEEFSFLDILQDMLGLRVGWIDGVIGAKSADAHWADLLGVPNHASLVFRDYLLYDSLGKPISHGLSYYRNEVRFRYSTKESG